MSNPQPQVSKWTQVPTLTQIAEFIGVLSALATLASFFLSPTIEDWLSARWASMLKLGGWIAGRLPLPTHIPPQPDPNLLDIHIVQTFFILIFLFIQYNGLKNVEEDLGDDRPIAQRTFKQFRFSWMMMWIGWLAFYIWFIVRLGLPASNALDALNDAFDVIQVFAIWCCFLVLHYPSVKTENEPGRDRLYRKGLRIAGGFCILCFCLGSADRSFGLGHLGLIAIGLYGALATASLGGRLMSHYIGMPLWQLLSLYLYAMIQISYSFFDLLPSPYTRMIFIGALVEKLILCFIGFNMFQYGGLNNYLRAAEQGLLSGKTLSAKDSGEATTAIKEADCLGRSG